MADFDKQQLNLTHNCHYMNVNLYKWSLTLRTWYQTEVPPKSMWKSVKLSLTPIRQYFCTSGRSGTISSGMSSGHKVETQLTCFTTLGGSTSSDNLKTKWTKNTSFSHTWHGLTSSLSVPLPCCPVMFTPIHAHTQKKKKEKNGENYNTLPENE